MMEIHPWVFSKASHINDFIKALLHYDDEYLDRDSDQDLDQELDNYGRNILDLLYYNFPL